MNSPRTWDDAVAVLADAIPNYESRPEQVTLARAIESALEDQAALVGQGGCGVGKSFAALVPAALSGRRTIYSTGTKALQDQIANKDLPFLAQHFQFTHAILKGRSNYLCRDRLNVLPDGSVKVTINATLNDAKLRGVEIVGEQSDFVGIADNEWRDVTVTGEECPGKKSCQFGESCFAESAKEKAKAAQVVVVNHALLVTDTLVKAATEGEASMVGEYDHLIIDEAHEFADYVGNGLETTYRLGGMLAFITELRNFLRGINIDDNEQLDSLNDSVRQFFDWLPEGRLKQSFIVDEENGERFMKVIEALHALVVIINSEATSEAMPQWNPNETDASQRLADKGKSDKARVQRRRLRTRGLSYLSGLQRALLEPDANMVRYVTVQENRRSGEKLKVFVVRPVMVDEWLQDNLWQFVSPVLISATLLIDGKPDFIVSQLGLSSPRVIDAGTPFDYQRQAKLYIPRDITDPSNRSREADRERDVFRQIETLVNASEGRALVLFTSNKALRNAYGELSQRLNYTCRKQGDASPRELMEWFKSETDSVLFATKSFFTGIDVQGDSLSLVVIDKLPFPVPTEPVFEALCEEVVRRGGNDFRDVTIPAMTLPLQQAFGRLIRTKLDTGVVAILDPRLLTKPYGKTIVRSLPNAPIVESLGEVQRFFEAQAVAS